MQVAYGWGDLGNAVCASGTRGGQGSAGHGDLGATAEVARQNGMCMHECMCEFVRVHKYVRK